MNDHNLDELEREILENPDARAAALENSLRRELASAIDEAREAGKISIRGLADSIGTSVSQVQRLLHRELAGSLTLRTICRAVDKLDLCISLHIRPRTPKRAQLVPFGNVIWTASEIEITKTCGPRLTGSRRPDDGWQRVVGKSDPPTEERVA
jgi:hypothetical protein